MKFDFAIQNDKINLGELIDKETIKKPKKIYMFMGALKESGFNIIEESMIDSNAKYVMFLGIDKKDTTKVLLESILKYTKDIYVYNNNDLKEFKSNTFIFEFEKTAIIYLSSLNNSKNSLTDDLSIFSKIEYNLIDENEKKEYKKNLKLLMTLKKSSFIKLNKTIIKTLIDDKVIFSKKQYTHKVKSISEFLGKEKINSKSEIDSKKSIDSNIENLDLPLIDLSKSNIEIDISNDFELEDNSVKNDIAELNQALVSDDKKDKINDENIKINDENIKINDGNEENELNITEEISEEDKELFENTLDLNDMLLTKSKVKLNADKSKKVGNQLEEDIVMFKKLDLNNISNYLFELPARKQNGKDLNVIKIPNYIKELIPNFFGFSEDIINEVINGAEYKVKNIKVEVVDAINNIKMHDDNSKIMQKKGQTYITIMSEKISEINYEEKDIVRIIKLSNNIYHIEFVSKDMQEYKIWSKIMNKKLKGVDRKYGIM